MTNLKISALTPLTVVALLMTAAPARADIRLSMHDGLVTLVAKDATVRQILAEWARVGQTKIVNAEKIGGAPVSIELTDVPEKQALDILLRSVNGYLAAPRPTLAPNASRFDRILVLPAAAQPRSVSSSGPAPPPMPQPLPQPQQRFQLAPLPPELEEAPVQIQNPNPNLPVDLNQRQPAVNFFPTPAIPLQGAGRVGTAPPSGTAAPVGASVPGVIVQPPAQQQPGKF